ncbi:MAG: hypothetical protein JSS07_07660 [Proteobacteria bacterium]|nr:hypothetical protein [Pseudomonadota bacterium]
MLNSNQDIIQPIFSFLSQEEAFALRSTCKAFNIAATSNQIMMPFLNRLKAIDNKVCVLAPNDVNTSWCYEHFIREFNRIVKRQTKETAFFLNVDLDYIETQQIQIEINKLRSLHNNIEKNKIQLGLIEEIHETLDRLNIALIKTRVNLNNTQLNLSNLGITRIPESLFKLPEYQTYLKNLETMHLYNNLLQTLPEEIGRCKSLKDLLCFNNQIQTLPESLGLCQALERLWCQQNSLQTLPNSLSNCQKLHTLGLSKNQFQVLPEFLTKCQSLQDLGLDFNYLQSLPEFLGNLPALKTLACSTNALQSLPRSLGNSKTLTLLAIGNNRLRSLPESLGDCQALQKLYCGRNQLQFLPESLGRCQALSHLFCSENELRTLPESLGNCTALESIFCADNQLQTLPKSLGNCPLRSLSCSGNYLINLPNEIRTKFDVQWFNKTIKNQKSSQAHFQKIKLAMLAAVFINIALTTSIFALSGGFAFSMIASLGITTTLFWLYHCRSIIKIAFTRHGLSEKAIFFEDMRICDNLLHHLTKKFSTNTVLAFVRPLRNMERNIFRTEAEISPELIQFKQFEIATFKKLAPLKGEAREQAKAFAFKKAKKKFPPF